MGKKNNAGFSPLPKILPSMPPAALPPYISSPEDKGERLQAMVFRTVMEHSDICICSGFVPDRSKLCELAEQYDGVLVIFENISDELTML